MATILFWENSSVRFDVANHIFNDQGQSRDRFKFHKNILPLSKIIPLFFLDEISNIEFNGKIMRRKKLQILEIGWKYSKRSETKNRQLFQRQE
jgi:hypothetical protein